MQMLSLLHLQRVGSRNSLISPARRDLAHIPMKRFALLFKFGRRCGCKLAARFLAMYFGQKPGSNDFRPVTPVSDVNKNSGQERTARSM